MSTTIALREWAGVIDAMGNGTQTIMVRSFVPKHNIFFLYPTYSYYTAKKHIPALFESKFQQQYLQLAKDSAERTSAQAKDFLGEFKYFAEVEQVIGLKKSLNFSKLEPFMIWSADHLAEYAQSNNQLFLWLLRIYKLENTITIGRAAAGGPPTYYHHPVPLSTDESKPVLPEDKFQEVSKKILSIVGTK